MGFNTLSEDLFVEAAGAQTVQRARSLLTQGKVLSSNWSPHCSKVSSKMVVRHFEPAWSSKVPRTSTISAAVQSPAKPV